MQRNSTNSNEIFEILLRDSLSEKLSNESKELGKATQKHDFKSRFLKGIKRIARRINAEKRRKIVFKVTFKSLLSVSCTLGVVFCVLLTQPTVYAAVSGVVRNVFSGYDKYSYHGDYEEKVFNTEIRPQYIPEGFELRMVYYSDVNMSITYDDADVREICLDYGLMGYGSTSVDNENSVYTLFVQNGTEYHYYETTHEYGYNVLMWVKDGYHFMLTSQLEKDVLVQIAENIK